MEAWIVWGQFVGVGALVCVAGYFLSKYGDVVSDRTGWGGNWVGLVLLASITSLPELITGVSAVSVADSPDIGVGEIMGSCVFNLFIIGVLDFLRPQPILHRVSPAQILTASFGVLLIALTTFAILLSDRYPYGIAHVGWASVLIPATYAIAMVTIYRFEQGESAVKIEEFGTADAEIGDSKDVSLRKAVIYTVISALVVIGAALYLPVTAKGIVAVMGWNEAFVGTLFVALVTSLPEVAVTVSAVRLGAYDMAVANVLGSNLFNILILTFEDLAYTKGPLLADVSAANAVTGVVAVLMSAAVVVGILHRPKKALFGRISMISLFLILMFAVNLAIVFGS